MTISKPVIFLKDQKGHLRAIIEVIPDWEGFGKLVKYLEINYHAKIVKSYDGPDARRWIISIDKTIIELIHNDDYGNYFIAPTKDSEATVYEIGKDLENRLRKLEEKP